MKHGKSFKKILISGLALLMASSAILPTANAKRRHHSNYEHLIRTKIIVPELIMPTHHNQNHHYKVINKVVTQTIHAVHHNKKHHHKHHMKSIKQEQQDIANNTRVVAQTPQQANNKPVVVKPQKENHSHQYKKLFKVAKSKLGDPYSWGASGPNIFDCSGFVQYVYQHGLNKSIPRSAQTQYDEEKHIPLSKIKPGDLIFFGTSPSSITHVGMYIGNDEMIDDQLRGVVIEKIHVPWWNAVCASRP